MTHRRKAGSTDRVPEVRRFLPLFLLAAACANQVPTEAEIEVIEVTGYVDDSVLAYLRDSIEAAAEADRELVIVQFDAEAVVGSEEELAATAELLSQPPLPLVAWLSPEDAVARGGVERLVDAAPMVAAQPGTDTGGVEVDVEAPSIRQLVQTLDGQAIRSGDEPLSTITSDVPNDEEGVTTVPVTFTQPGLWHRFTHLGARPEAAFFFLVLGLSVAAFEYFALGPGLAAAAAALSLFLAGYGMAVVPPRPSALAASILGLLILVAGNQRGSVLAFTLLGTGLVTWAGFNFSGDAVLAPVGVIGVVFSVLTVLFFFLLAIPAVGRARFSTQTIGRDGLIGRPGLALADFDPDGLVEIEGARWPATAHRAAGIKQGDPVVVTAVAGREVEVEPRENPH